MNYRDLARAFYRGAIEDIHMHTELRKALKTHERVPVFIDNLAGQLKEVEQLRIKQGKKPIKLTTIKSVIYDFTKLFIKSFEAHAEKRAASDIKKREAKQKDDIMQGKVDLPGVIDNE